jgi:hypothetical protein
MAFLILKVQTPAQTSSLNLSSWMPTFTENGPDTGIDKEEAALYHAGQALRKTFTQSVKSFVNFSGFTMLVLALVTLTGLFWAVFLSVSSNLTGEAKQHFYKGKRTHKKQNHKPGQSDAFSWSNIGLHSLVLR